MNGNKTLPDRHLGIQNWKKVGEINNLPGSDIGLIQSWLGIVFSHINLSSRYMNEFIKTVKLVSSRAAAAHTGMKIFTHLAVYVPHGQSAKCHTWGLFHMERIQLREPVRNALDHNIKFYLYLEGDAN